MRAQLGFLRSEAGTPHSEPYDELPRILCLGTPAQSGNRQTAINSRHTHIEINFARFLWKVKAMIIESVSLIQNSTENIMRAVLIDTDHGSFSEVLEMTRCGAAMCAAPTRRNPRNFHLRPEKGPQLVYHKCVETHNDLFHGRAKAKTIESIFPM